MSVTKASGRKPEHLRYRLLTGPDDRHFCERVSQALAAGYELYGSPSISISGGRVMVAQAVIWPMDREDGQEKNAARDETTAEESESMT